ncbi:hypothetical protein HYPSUDRAFT_656127 [Hypholoma sublateritium FD-334 SS-4]|uniref:Uncharacterized protein n=1 Tax=Hypholoma sublateritium (strain FD-334 SS-4) TaxID=945553 RepID=A0A0D2L661_HYPSF|nr:hypothetical protein HYPSUDRAFT_656127 [Hypholoma sublateritium FD-334 SS-4]
MSVVHWYVDSIHVCISFYTPVFLRTIFIFQSLCHEHGLENVTCDSGSHRSKLMRSPVYSRLCKIENPGNTRTDIGNILLIFFSYSSFAKLRPRGMEMRT